MVYHAISLYYPITEVQLMMVSKKSLKSFMYMSALLIHVWHIGNDTVHK